MYGHDFLYSYLDLALNFESCFATVGHNLKITPVTALTVVSLMVPHTFLAPSTFSNCHGLGLLLRADSPPVFTIVTFLLSGQAAGG